MWKMVLCPLPHLFKPTLHKEDLQDFNFGDEAHLFTFHAGDQVPLHSTSDGLDVGLCRTGPPYPQMHLNVLPSRADLEAAVAAGPPPAQTTYGEDLAPFEPPQAFRQPQSAKKKRYAGGAKNRAFTPVVPKTALVADEDRMAAEKEQWGATVAMIEAGIEAHLADVTFVPRAEADADGVLMPGSFTTNQA